MADDNMFAEFAGEPGAKAVAEPKPAADGNMFAEFATPKVGLWDSFMTGNIEGASFGVAGDREHREASRKANPWTHFMGEVTGSIAPMAAATLLPTGAGQVAAAGRGANLLSKGLKLLVGWAGSAFIRLVLVKCVVVVQEFLWSLVGYAEKRAGGTAGVLVYRLPV